jgi:hypothetical protein
VVAVNQVFLDDLVLKLSKWSDTQTIGDVLERMVRRPLLDDSLTFLDPFLPPVQSVCK